jgi:predicted ATPase
MIKKITLNNFFSFRDTVVDLEQDVNLLVGINGSGKSNLFKGFDLLKRGMKGELAELIREWGGFENVFCKCPGGTAHADSVGIKFLLDAAHLSKYNYHFLDDVEYQIILRKKPAFDNFDVIEWVNFVKTGKDEQFTQLSFNHGRGYIIEKKIVSKDISDKDDIASGIRTWHKVEYDDKNPEELVLADINDSDRYPALTALSKALKSIDLYHYLNVRNNSPLRRSMSATGEEKLHREGDNLFPVLNTLEIKHTQVSERIRERLNVVNDKFNDLRFLQYGSGVFQAFLKEKKLTGAIHAAHVSDGTLLFLCLLAILLNPAKGSVVFIDEPEKGLHPDMLVELGALIAEASLNSQIIIATHSPQLLNGFKLRNIRVFEKDESNTSVVKSYEESDFSEWYEEFAPGYMWEKGEFGGVRY